MKIIQRDILTIETGVICHQVNCRGRMASGLAGAIASKWPQVKRDYLETYQQAQKDHIDLLGTISFTIVIPNLVVANLFGQRNFGRSGQFTDYSALRNALQQVEQCFYAQGMDVYLPYKIGCGLGGGDWEKVSKIITEIMPEATICVPEEQGEN